MHVNNDVCCRKQSEGLFSDAERDLLAIAKFLVIKSDKLSYGHCCQMSGRVDDNKLLPATRRDI